LSSTCPHAFSVSRPKTTLRMIDAGRRVTFVVPKVYR
jgi:hypothetical protein